MNEKVLKLKKQLAELKKEVEECKNSDALKHYIDTMSVFHNYSLRNCMLIYFQFPNATKVAGFRTWQKLNRFVKKGEHGIHILAPCKSKKVDEQTGDEESLLYFRSVCVFDVSQTSGDNLPEWDISTPEQKIELLDTLIEVVRSANIEVEYVDDLKAYGTSSGGKIQLRNNENTATTFTTLIHEYAHEILHSGQENLNLNREEKEVEAETVSYIVCKHFNIQNSAAKYLATWMKRDDIFNHLERIRTASSQIISKLEPNNGKEETND